MTSFKDLNSKQAVLALGLYAISIAAFLFFWTKVMFGGLSVGTLLIASVLLWLLTGVLAVRTQFFIISRTAWGLDEGMRDSLATVFILWNITNIAILALDAAMRKAGSDAIVYPWFMLLSISLGYGALMRRCAALAFPQASREKRLEDLP